MGAPRAPPEWVQGQFWSPSAASRLPHLPPCSQLLLWELRNCWSPHPGTTAATSNPPKVSRSHLVTSPWL